MTEFLPSHVLSFLEKALATDLNNCEVQEAKSAQQKVWIVTTPPSKNMNDLWSKALETGRNRIVVREWRGSARWWNLNSNTDSPVSLARAEVAAYRIAHDALPHQAIPVLLHFFNDDDESNIKPWAIFSYVGQHCSHYNETNRQFTRIWKDGMVKVRPEFGFDEPHPRWGRVPVEKAVDYTLKVLRTVIIPLHKFIANNNAQQWNDLTDHVDGRARSYGDMVSLYRKAHSKMSATLDQTDTKNKEIQHLVDALGKGIDKLETDATSISEVQAVLVHMDCQPQNLFFSKSNDDGSTCISSVLDWEEAAYADPRFELLLLGRKVCANRKQADNIWQTYERECQPLGPIVPWLRLETVHSITTLVLQSLNLLGGGRNPWESKPDLWGKLERELHRLDELDS